MTKILPCRLKQSFGRFNMLSVHKCSDTGSFRHLRKVAFCRRYLHKQITPEAHLSFESIATFMPILEMQIKMDEIFFDLQIIALELVALKKLFYRERILVIGCQSVN